ncbi:MAG: PilZ domain-containing protein [Croceibacterium sp.]
MDERRSAERLTIEVSLTCRMPARPLRSVVRDISHHGCRIEVSAGQIELGGTALLELPGVGHVSGRVVWIHGKAAGVRFDRALGRPAAVALGLEEPKPVEASPVSEIAMPPQGILHHWFRRLTACFS